MEYLCVATPEFAARYFGEPSDTQSLSNTQPFNGISQAQLAKAPAVVFSTKDKLHEKFLAQYFNMTPGQWWQHTIPSSESF